MRYWSLPEMSIYKDYNLVIVYYLHEIYIKGNTNQQKLNTKTVNFSSWGSLKFNSNIKQ